MKRYFKINKDKKLRQKFLKKELLWYFYKTLFYSVTNENFKFYVFDKIKKLKTFKIKIRNRCLKSGVSTYISRKFKIHRMFLKQYINLGYINGFSKSSW